MCKRQVILDSNRGEECIGHDLDSNKGEEGVGQVSLESN